MIKKQQRITDLGASSAEIVTTNRLISKKKENIGKNAMSIKGNSSVASKDATISMAPSSHRETMNATSTVFEEEPRIKNRIFEISSLFSHFYRI